MIIIGFTNKTSKILPRIFCRKFRHAAIILPDGDRFVMYQFVRRRQIVLIQLKARDIKILIQHGWDFILTEQYVITKDCAHMHVFTCVQLAKEAIGMRNIWIQTPYALYRKLKSLEI
ncbi:MAG: hypothetical protein II208_04615 [Alphaproteobacteria bacterium]|nr:hypothetical protein [Alphaproteobacteria bacterium]